MAKRSRAGGAKARKPKDVALILDRTEDREGFHVLRRRSEEAPVELGTVRPLQEGKPIDGEVVSLRQREDVPFAFDVKTELPDTRRATSAGPPQVASDEYRRGWEAIWGQGTAVQERPAGDKPN
jgi:hypothetical protein